MSSSNQIQNSDTGIMFHSQLKGLYIIGAISTLMVAVLVIAAIVAYLIWPYPVGKVPTEELLSLLHNDTLVGLITLDISLLVIMLVNIFPYLAMYGALKQVNQSYALIALSLGLIGVSLVVFTRPLVELVDISHLYASATDPGVKMKYITTAETLLALFHGTAWIVQTFLFGISGIINASLMLKSPIFSKLTAYTGLVISIMVLGFFLPVVGLPLLFLNTIGTILFYTLVSNSFIKAIKAA